MKEKRATLILIKNLSIFLSGALVITYLAGCSDSGMDRNKFVSFYADYITAQDSSGFNPKVSGEIRENLFKKYGITAAEYEKTVNNLKNSRNEWEAFFNEVIAELEKRRDKEVKISF